MERREGGRKEEAKSTTHKYTNTQYTTSEAKTGSNFAQKGPFFLWPSSLSVFSGIGMESASASITPTSQDKGQRTVLVGWLAG